MESMHRREFWQLLKSRLYRSSGFDDPTIHRIDIVDAHYNVSGEPFVDGKLNATIYELRSLRFIGSCDGKVGLSVFICGPLSILSLQICYPENDVRQVVADCFTEAVVEKTKSYKLNSLHTNEEVFSKKEDHAA